MGFSPSQLPEGNRIFNTLCLPLFHKSVSLIREISCIVFPLTIIGLFADIEGTPDNHHFLSLVLNHFRFSQFTDDLLTGETFSWHFVLPPYLNPNINVGSVFRGRVKRRIHNTQKPMFGG